MSSYVEVEDTGGATDCQQLVVDHLMAEEASGGPMWCYFAEFQGIRVRFTPDPLSLFVLERGH